MANRTVKKLVVKVYSTQTCPYCVVVKDFLKEKGIPFEDIDVSADQAAAMEMISVSGQMGVPVVIIDGKVIVGFNKPAIIQALGLE